MMNKIFAFDNTLGYKWGNLVFLGFYLSQLIILLADGTKGVARDYLTIGSLLCTFSYLIYLVYFYQGRAASTPGQVAMLTESLARWLVAAHYGVENVVDSSTIGAWNGLALTLTGIFLVQKMAVQLYVNFNRDEYLTYEKSVLDKAPSAAVNNEVNSEVEVTEA